MPLPRNKAHEASESPMPWALVDDSANTNLRVAIAKATTSNVIAALRQGLSRLDKGNRDRYTPVMTDLGVIKETALPWMLVDLRSGRAIARAGSTAMLKLLARELAPENPSRYAVAYRAQPTGQGQEDSGQGKLPPSIGTSKEQAAEAEAPALLNDETPAPAVQAQR